MYGNIFFRYQKHRPASTNPETSHMVTSLLLLLFVTLYSIISFFFHLWRNLYTPLVGIYLGYSNYFVIHRKLYTLSLSPGEIQTGCNCSYTELAESPSLLARKMKVLR